MCDKIKVSISVKLFDNFEIKNGSHLVEDYARVFIEGVNFYEIAENINYDID